MCSAAAHSGSGSEENRLRLKAACCDDRRGLDMCSTGGGAGKSMCSGSSGTTEDDAEQVTGTTPKTEPIPMRGIQRRPSACFPSVSG
jgi:hypothetical protein